jgi:hypothetical protein
MYVQLNNLRINTEGEKRISTVPYRVVHVDGPRQESDSYAKREKAGDKINQRMWDNDYVAVNIIK